MKNTPALMPKTILPLIPLATLGLFLMLVSYGCSGNPLGRLGVSGKVTLDGKPLSQGMIQFEPLGNKKPRVGSGVSIADGEYSIPTSQGLPPGEYRVRIYSAIVISQQEGANSLPGVGDNIITRETIPPIYNANSELIVPVKDSGSNTLNFDLKSH